MKALAIIWVAVLVSGIGTLAYVNAAIDELVVSKPFTVSEVKAPYNPQKTIDGSKLQPAAVVQPNFTVTYNPQQTAPASVLTTVTDIN